MARTIAKDHEAKRQTILETAARVFAEEGIARASMSGIADACGISKANIYHYYDSKDALLFGILDSYLSRLRDRFCATPPGLSAEERLRWTTTETLLAYQGMDHEHKIQTEALPLLQPAQQETLKGYQRDMVAHLSAVLADLAPEVFGDQPATLRETTMSVFGMLNWFYMWNRNADEAARRQYGDRVARLTIGGVRGL